MQSVFNTGSPEADALSVLWWVFFWVCLAVFVAVMVLLALGLSGRGRAGPGTALVWVGAAISVPILVGLLLFSARTGTSITAGSATGKALRIEVVGKMWWWEVRYPVAGAELANELRLPAGRPVEIVLSSDTVIHSFWVPGLAGKVDMIPGHTNVLAITPARTGTYRGQCAEFCGAQHALMAFMVVVEEEGDFDRWLANEARPALEPPTPLAARGRDAFMAAGCGSCHRVRGTPANGKAGPDLTHVGGRLTIGAGILPQNVGTLGGWIANSQAIKPGNLMPKFDQFDGETLRAIATWLAGLE